MKKYSYLYEIPIFFALLLAANYVFFRDQPGFIEINPNPLWIGILLFGFRYGITAGGLAGLTATAFYLVTNWYYGESYLFEDTTFYFMPSLFIIVGIIIGVGVFRYHTRIEKLKETTTLLNLNFEHSVNEIEALKKIKQELEKKITSKMTTLITVHEGARNLESGTVNDTLKTCLWFFAKTLDVGAAGIYTRAGRTWELKATHKNESFNQALPETFHDDSGMVGQCLDKARLVSLRDYSPDGNIKLQGLQPLIVGPLRAGESGNIIALFVIFDIPLLSLNTATFSLFSFLLGWGSRSLGRAQAQENLQSREIIDPEYNVFSYRYLETRLKQEFVRSKTYYLPLTVMLIAIRGLDTMHSLQKARVNLAVAALLKNTCRETDVIARFVGHGLSFGCLLTTTSGQQAMLIADKVQEGFTKLNFPTTFELKLGLASFTPQTTTPDEIIEQAMDAMTEYAA